MVRSHRLVLLHAVAPDVRVAGWEAFTMTRWEYKVISVWHPADNDDELLDNVGDGGWELVAVTPVNGGRLLYLKRPLLERVWSR